jgi:ABC-2 type transport system permease protein
MKTLLVKELREGWRTWRLIVLVIVLAVSGLISPVLAYYTPQLLRLIPDLPPGLAGSIPEPTTVDAVGQYVKNVNQFGLLLLVILAAGLIAAEKERGTAAMLFVRPVSRTNAVIAKWLVWVAGLAIGLLSAAGLALAYTAVLFELLPIGPFLLLNALLLLSFLPYLSLSLLASALAKTQGAAYGYAFIALFVLLIAGSLPRIGEFTPAFLPTWGAALALAQPLTAWPALAISVILIVAGLAGACVLLERQEL